MTNIGNMYGSNFTFLGVPASFSLTIHIGKMYGCLQLNHAEVLKVVEVSSAT